MTNTAHQRRTSSASLPRSQRVVSLVDLLPPNDSDQEEPETGQRQTLNDNEGDMPSAKRGVLGDKSTNGSNVTTMSEQPAPGLGINLNITQRLEKVDEWLEHENNEDVASSSSITPVSKVRGPRKQMGRRVPSSPQIQRKDEMKPPPLALPKRPPTTPSGGKRAYPEPVPKSEDVGKRPERFIDELLEGLYRDQAGSLTKPSKSHLVVEVEEESPNTEQTPPKRRQGQVAVPSVPVVLTPTRRSSNSSNSSITNSNSHNNLTQSHSSTGFAPSPARTDPFRPSPLRSARKPVETFKDTTQTLAFEPTSYKSFAILPSKEGPPPVEATPYAYAHRIYSKPETVEPAVVRFQHQRSHTVSRPALYFFDDERNSIQQSVLAKKIVCKAHLNCVECLEKEYSYLEIKTMPTTMPPEERAKILAGNRSLRTIKTELENLLENNLISDDLYNTIIEKLPNEGAFNTSSNTAASNNNNTTSSRSADPVSSFQALSVNEPPPAYGNQNNAPPPPPSRQQTAPPTRPELCRAVALYPYNEPADCTFVVGDEIAVYEYMNKDWWMGRNLRTGKEGVFPVNYVTQKASGTSPAPYANEKAMPYGGYQGQQQYPQPYGQQQYPQQQYPQQQYQQPHGPPPPGPSNPYNSDAPPEAAANEPNKGAEMGKKFGKKLGNAAIFGAGATIGSNIVNSIF